MDYKFIPDLAAEFAMPKDGIMSRVLHKEVVLQVSNADKFVAECLSCVLRLPNRKGCR
jgi:hypothetical protein